MTKLSDLNDKPKQVRDPKAEFDYPCPEARAFYAKQTDEAVFDESMMISSKTLADLFMGFDEKNKA